MRVLYACSPSAFLIATEREDEIKEIEEEEMEEGGG